jgi:hypothetical protein
VRRCFQKNWPCPPGLAVGTNPAPYKNTIPGNWTLRIAGKCLYNFEA